MLPRILFALALVALTACGGVPSTPVTPQTVVGAFKAAGLEAENTSPMTPEDYGPAPMAAEGLRFFIPSLGEDSGGRIMRFRSEEDAARSKTYYDEMGKASPIFHSWTYSKGPLVVQIDGTLPEDKAKQYEAAFQSIR